MSNGTQPRRLSYDDVLIALQGMGTRPQVLRFVADQLNDDFDFTDLEYTRSWLRAQLRDLADLLDRP